MREIKFRAWYESRKVMTDGFTLEHLLNTANTHSQLEFKDATSYTAVMQFTGLKDKNGKEIYEGDIVKIHPTLKMCVVKWDDEFALFKLVSFIDVNKIIKFRLSKSRPEYYEVIGNIYEHGDLIDK